MNGNLRAALEDYIPANQQQRESKAVIVAGVGRLEKDLKTLAASVAQTVAARLRELADELESEARDG